MLTLTKSSFPLIEAQPLNRQELWVWAAALTIFRTSHCVHVLGYETLQLLQAQWVCFVVTFWTSQYSVQKKHKTKNCSILGLHIQKLRLFSRDVHYYVIKSYEVGRYLKYPLYEPSVPNLALKCKAAVMSREALALQQPWTLVLKSMQCYHRSLHRKSFRICAARKTLVCKIIYI